MWIMLNDCFFSIVAKDCGRDELMVRARRPGDIEKLFPKAKVTEYTASDYHYRAAVKRTDLAAALAAEVDGITYSNFKDSVRDRPLHDAYLSVWHAMARLQPKKPYAGASWIRGRSLFDFEQADSQLAIEDLETRAPARGKGKKKAAGK